MKLYSEHGPGLHLTPGDGGAETGNLVGAQDGVLQHYICISIVSPPPAPDSIHPRLDQGWRQTGSSLSQDQDR